MTILSAIGLTLRLIDTSAFGGSLALSQCETCPFASVLVPSLRCLSLRFGACPFASVQTLEILLLYALDRDKAHLRSFHGFTDPFRIVIFVRIPLDIRLNKLETDQPDLMP
jgi:hypothetical protein